MSRYQDDPNRGKSASVRPFNAKPRLKKPEDDAVIAMARDRHHKGLQIEKQRHIMSGASGAVLHKILELKQLENDIKAIEEGVKEYQDQVGHTTDRAHTAGGGLPRSRSSRGVVGRGCEVAVEPGSSLSQARGFPHYNPAYPPATAPVLSPGPGHACTRYVTRRAPNVPPPRPGGPHERPQE